MCCRGKADRGVCPFQLGVANLTGANHEAKSWQLELSWAWPQSDALQTLTWRALESMALVEGLVVQIVHARFPFREDLRQIQLHAVEIGSALAAPPDASGRRQEKYRFQLSSCRTSQTCAGLIKTWYGPKVHNRRAPKLAGLYTL